MRDRFIKRFFISLGAKVLPLLFAVGTPIDHRLLGLSQRLTTWSLTPAFLGCHRRVAFGLLGLAAALG
jgi:hypothetical protein